MCSMVQIFIILVSCSTSLNKSMLSKGLLNTKMTSIGWRPVTAYTCWTVVLVAWITKCWMRTKTPSWVILSTISLTTIVLIWSWYRQKVTVCLFSTQKRRWLTPPLHANYVKLLPILFAHRYLSMRMAIFGEVCFGKCSELTWQRWPLHHSR